MKATFAIFLFCVAYACAAPKGDNSSELEKLVAEQKVIVEAIRRDLIDSDRSISQDASLKLEEGKINAKRSVDKVIETAHEDIRERYEIALEEGRDATECYQTAKTKLEEVTSHTHNILNQSFEGLKTTVKGRLVYVLDAAESAAKLSANLDTIIPECNELSSDELEKCVRSRLDDVKPKVQKLEEYSETVKTAAQDTLDKAVNEGGVWKIAVINTADFAVYGEQGIRANAITCIWLAPKH